MIRCILACDLKGGLVVRGYKGDRKNYLPVSATSIVVDSAAPEEVIMALTPKETYIADLDRITGNGNNLDMIGRLSGMTRTMADTGIKDKKDIEETLKVACKAVAGTETAPLSLIRERGEDIVLSLDMKEGKMVAADASLRVPPLEALKVLNDIPLGAVILLDIGRVGSFEGVDLKFLEAVSSLSRHDIIVGGGMRDMIDVEAAERAGASGVILASAIHDGRVPSSVLRA